ncbi:prepilin-type N-terminal cleavage/methylation domain-containing protein [Colwelliaceae bacterium 6441]
MHFKNALLSNKNKGFTLIETIVGIVVLAISFSLITTLIYPLVGQSADQLHQIKAAELGQSIINEIQNKAFDENSDKTGGLIRCGEGTDCTPYDKLTNEEGGVRASFDDVDDYNGVVLDEDDFVNSFGDDLADKYVGYVVDIKVCNDGNYDGVCSSQDVANSDTFTAKLITVTVTTPTDAAIAFSTYRANF